MKRIVMLMCLAALLVGCGEETEKPQAQPQPTQENETPPGETVTEPEPPADQNTQAQDEDRPRVAVTRPAAGIRDVDPATERIVIVFSEDMIQQAIAPDRLEGCEYPKNTAPAVFEDPRTLVLSVKLEENKIYGLSFNKRNEAFKSAAGKPLAPFEMRFATGKEEGRFCGLTPLEKKHRKGEIPQGQYYINTLIEEGDGLKATSKFTLVITEQATMQGPYGPTPSVSVKKLTYEQEVKEKVLEIVKESLRKQGYDVARSVVGSSVQGMAEQQQEMPIMGKKYLLETNGDEVCITCNGRRVSEGEKAQIADIANYPDLYPLARAVKIDEEWSLKSNWLESCVLDALSAGATLETAKSEDYVLTCKLVGVKNENRRQVASIEVECKANMTSGTLKKTFPITINGKVKFDITNRRIDSMQIRGSGTVSGTMLQMPNAEIQSELQFEYEINWDYD